MKINIIIPYRPSNGGLDSPTLSITQNDNFDWVGENNIIYERVGFGEQDIDRCIKALFKNSVYRHNIIVAIDHDMFPHKDWLKKYGERVSIFKSSRIDTKVPQERQMHTMREALLQFGDEEFVGHSYIADLVCGKYWDKYIDIAYRLYGDNAVFIPAFVEPRTSCGNGMTKCVGPDYKALIDGLGELTVDNIWHTWRAKSCHALTIKPPTDRDYFKEEDLDNWSAVCNQYKKEFITEPSGGREFIYWAPMISKNKNFKRVAHLLRGFGSDLAFDNEMCVAKVMPTKSHVFHFHSRCELDNVEVEHIDE